MATIDRRIRTTVACHFIMHAPTLPSPRQATRSPVLLIERAHRCRWALSHALQGKLILAALECRTLVVVALAVGVARGSGSRLLAKLRLVGIATLIVHLAAVFDHAQAGS